MKKFAASSLLLLVACSLVACGGSGESDVSPRDVAHVEAEKNRDDFTPYIPKHGVEGANYNGLQELADDPATILWCTSFPASATAPIVTVPIVGKLTSSSVSAFPGERAEELWGEGAVTLPEISVDGLYHGDPPPYRFGFTPGGQLVSFENIPTICTTSVMAFQRQSINVKVDSGMTAATRRAEGRLRKACGSTVTNKPCASPEAQAALEAAAGQ